VAVVNEAFARKYFAGRDPIGRHITIGESNQRVPELEIVGVAADSRVDVRQPAKETWYCSYAQNPDPKMFYYVRTTADPNRIASDVRRVVRAADPGIPIGDLKPMDIRIGESIYTERLIAILSGVFGLLATLLAAIGIYGVVAYAVARRTAEIGIRIALGAQPSRVLRMILLEAGRMAALGIVIGLAAAFALSRLVASQLFGVQPADPAVFTGAAAGLALVALAAALVPAWRAARIQPVQALKFE
jgi:ABC-type antimicrobial peptide transport system permease subunit